MKAPRHDAPRWTSDLVIEAPGVRVRLLDFISTGPVEFTRLGDNSLFMTPSNYPGQPIGHYGPDRRSDEFDDVGNLVFLPADIPLHIRGDSPSTVRSIACTFERDKFEDVTGLGRDWNDWQLKAALNIRENRISQMMLRLMQEALAPGFASASLVEGLALTIMVDLSRYLHGARRQDERQTGRLAPWQLKRITSYIEDISGYAVTISDLAALCGISASHLKRVFKNTTGETIHEYTEQMRLSKAKFWLCETSTPLKQIAADLGFASLSGFSIAFRRRTGETPSGFRKQFGKHRVA